MRCALFIAAGAVAAATLSAAPAFADDTVVVRGLDFGGGTTSLAITGCPALFDRVAEPIATYLSKSSDAPAGTRSLKYDLAGGNAVGSQHAVASMTGTSVAGLSVFAPAGATGVAYAGYQPPQDWGGSLVWVGRADLSARAGGWQQVDATGLTYTWTQYDLADHHPVATSDEALTVAAFAEAHGGDGPGFWTVGFGCDGNPFKIDALRIGTPGDVTTYDLEGYTSSAAINGSRTSIAAGDEVTVSGSLRDERGEQLAHGLLVLEAQKYGAHTFTPVEGAAAPVDGGDPTVTVRPTSHTVYRWRFAGTWTTDPSVSPTFAVDVATVITAETDDSGVEAGDPLAVVGTTTPAQPGVRATLWRLTAKGRVPLGTTLLDGVGRFRFEVPAAVEAPWRYVVTVPAAHGNLAGQSPAGQVRVVR